jgi:hypothetical protein
VGVEREKWSVDPFAGVIKDGYVVKAWGSQSEIGDWLSTVNGGEANDAIRQVLTALYKIAGTMDVFKQFMKLIPNSAKDLLIAGLEANQDELRSNEKHGAEKWGSQEAVNKLVENKA